jgi:ABC-type spermidine/putrescine transport system permease subunit I
VLVVYPLARLFIGSLGTSSMLGSHGLGNYVRLVRTPADLHAFADTFADSAIVTVLALAMGAVIAWYLRTQRSRLLQALLWLAVLVPFWMGIVVKNYIFAVLLDRLGPVSTVLHSLGLVSAPVDLLYTQAAVVIGMLYSMLPYAVLPLFAAFSVIDLDLVKAAEGLGASRARALATVVAPLALPSALATTLIVFVISIGFYVTPILLGGESLPFVANTIQYDMFTAFDYPGAATASVLLLVAALIVVVVAQFLVGRERLERAIV